MVGPAGIPVCAVQEEKKAIAMTQRENAFMENTKVRIVPSPVPAVPAKGESVIIHRLMWVF